MNSSKYPGLMMFLTAGVVLYQIVEMTSGGEAESQGVIILHWFLMICGALGFIGAAIQYGRKNSEGG